MLPHESSGADSPPQREGRKDELMDLAWLEERALQYVARVETSAAGVARHLDRKIVARCERTGERPDLVVEMIPAVVAGLVERKYVDDPRFAARLLERQRREGRSEARIRARLTSKGISESLTDELFVKEAQEAPESEFRAAQKFARQRRLGPYSKNPEEQRQSRDRHVGVLCRQGFEPDMAQQIVDAREVEE